MSVLGWLCVDRSGRALLIVSVRRSRIQHKIQSSRMMLGNVADGNGSTSTWCNPNPNKKEKERRVMKRAYTLDFNNKWKVCHS